MLSIQLIESREDAQAGPHRALGVVAVRNGRTEDRHHSVADELLDHSTVMLNLSLGLGVIEVKSVAHVFRISPIRACGEVDQIDE